MSKSDKSLLVGKKKQPSQLTSSIETKGQKTQAVDLELHQEREADHQPDNQLVGQEFCAETFGELIQEQPAAAKEPVSSSQDSASLRNKKNPRKLPKNLENVLNYSEEVSTRNCSELVGTLVESSKKKTKRQQAAITKGYCKRLQDQDLSKVNVIKEANIKGVKQTDANAFLAATSPECFEEILQRFRDKKLTGVKCGTECPCFVALCWRSYETYYEKLPLGKHDPIVSECYSNMSELLWNIYESDRQAYEAIEFLEEFASKQTKPHNLPCLRYRCNEFKHSPAYFLKIKNKPQSETCSELNSELLGQLESDIKSFHLEHEVQTGWNRQTVHHAKGSPLLDRGKGSLQTNGQSTKGPSNHLTVVCDHTALSTSENTHSLRTSPSEPESPHFSSLMSPQLSSFRIGVSCDLSLAHLQCKPSPDHPKMLRCKSQQKQPTVCRTKKDLSEKTEAYCSIPFQGSEVNADKSTGYLRSQEYAQSDGAFLNKRQEWNDSIEFISEELSSTEFDKISAHILKTPLQAASCRGPLRKKTKPSNIDSLQPR